MSQHKRSFRRMGIPLGLFTLAVLSFLVGCPGPSHVPEEIPSPGPDVPQAPLVPGDTPPDPLPSASASPIESSEQEIPGLAITATGVESALLSSDLDRLVSLAHPQRRDEFLHAFGEAVDAMAEFGRGFADRRMISLSESQALYSVFVPGFGEYLVEFSRTDKGWWLALWTPF